MVVPTLAVAPEDSAKVAARLVTEVPFGMVMPMVLDVELMTALPVWPGSENELKSARLLELTVTVTVQLLVVEPSCAVTTYVTGFAKLFDVLPLTCVVVPTLAVAPEDSVKVAARLVTEIPFGMVIPMVLDVELMTALPV